MATGEYLYGTYGHLADSVSATTEDNSTAALYIGTAPINLIRGYADAGLVNKPVRLKNLYAARNTIGDAENWDTYTLSEAVAAHFANANGNQGPIYVINVLDPDTHRKAEPTSVTLNFVNGSAAFASEDIILDTLALADKAEGTDYTISYNFDTHKVSIVSADEDNPLDGAIAATYYEVDASAITESTIIGSANSNGTYTGMQAAALIYQTYNVIINLFAAPKWGGLKNVYKALCAIATKLNGHWDGFVYADIPLAYTETTEVTTYTYDAVTSPTGSPADQGWYEKDADDNYTLSTDTTVDTDKTYYTRTAHTEEETVDKVCDTIAKAVEYKEANNLTSERSKVFWPKASGADGRIYHLSTLAIAETMRVDGTHNGVPMETCGNKAIAADKQYFGATSSNAGYDVEGANDLCENGITTLVFWGGAWKIWGDHTAAYTFGNEELDDRAIFDVSMRMLLYLTNRFQVTWANTVDKPFTVQLKDTILVREQERLDALVVMGALIGKPTIVFEEAYNTIDDVKHGNFRWDIAVTPTPPMKSATAYVAYTDAGLSAYFD